MGSFASQPERLRLITSYYTGNGVDNRNIDIARNLLGMRDVFIFIKSTAANEPVWRYKAHVGDLSSYFGNAADAANLIQAFTNTGFQVGTNASVNQDTFFYRVVIFYER